jgi:hypothetical protein
MQLRYPEEIKEAISKKLLHKNCGGNILLYKVVYYESNYFYFRCRKCLGNSIHVDDMITNNKELK